MELLLRIEKMTCEHCAVTVRKALAAVPGVRAAQVSFAKGRAAVEVGADTPVAELAAAVARAGYAASLWDTQRAEARSAPGAKRRLLILGGGSGAFAAAIRAAELGAEVTMVERGTIGGTCVNVGCVPSKTLIKAAETHYRGSHHPFAGVPSTDGPVRLGALIGQKAELVERLRQAKYRDVLEAYPGVEYVAGEASFVDSRRVAIRLAGGGSREVESDRIVIATGAVPWAPPIPGLEGISYWTNVEALEAQELPARLAVIGGSAVGVELAQVYARLGSRVTLFEILPTLVPNEDSDLGRTLETCLREEGIGVHTGTEVRGVGQGARGFRLRFRTGGEEADLEADRLLVATGRRANLAGVRLEAAGVATEKGFIKVDARLRTSQPHIYAVGDCTRLPQFVYVAAKAGTLAAENALGEDGGELDLAAMPAVTFTDPQVASVGLTERKARERGLEVEARSLPLEHVPRALANRDTRGLMKIVAERGSGRILGVHLVSPAAGEVIQTGVLAVKLGLTVEQVAKTLFPYLTEVEGLKLAAQTFSKRVEQLSCCAG